MTLRPEYSLGHSAYNDFLFGSLGPEAAGMEVTILSALSRLGIDPWREAARLAALPREDAAASLADIILRLPDRTGPEADVPMIAARLVALLPRGAVADIPQTKEARVASLEAAVRSERARQKTKEKAATAITRHAAICKPKAGYTTWLIWGAIALAFYFLVVQFTPAWNLDSGDRETQQGS